MKFKSIPRWKKIKILQTLVAIIIIISITSISVYSLRHSQSPLITSGEAVRLKIVAPKNGACGIGVEEEIKIYAVDELDRIVRTRNDTIKLSLSSDSATLNATKITLRNGEAAVTIFCSINENLLMEATWLDGESYLESAIEQLFFGEFQ
ncbi:MAG: hypothetical protein NWF08_08140 [Candidatus Bathyarchaeota archaeon]|nr:hypothetical protein [Candidatus Bathyarchaeota archaeon]